MNFNMDELENIVKKIETRQPIIVYCPVKIVKYLKEQLPKVQFVSFPYDDDKIYITVEGKPIKFVWENTSF